MASIKITALPDIAGNLAFTTIIPVVDMTGTPASDKANLQIVGNLFLSGAGGAHFVAAAHATTAATVTTAAQPNITSVGTLTSATVSGNVRVVVTGLISLNSWYHLAVTRSAGVVYFFIDGLLIGSSADTDVISIPDATYVASVGYCSSDYYGYKFYGYIDEIRVTNGIARYTGSFPAPTQAFPNAGPAIATDPYFANVSLLLKTNGIAGSTTFIDVSPINNTFNVYPSAITSTGVSHSGTSSVALSSSGYLDLVNSNISAFDFGTADYTLECFIYATSLTSGPCILSKYTSWASAVSFNLEVYPTGEVRYIGGNGIALLLLSSAGVVTTNAWHHIAVTCTSGTTRIFVNGVSVASSVTVNSISSTSAHPFCIGKDSNTATQFFDGYIEDVRVTKGVSRYSATFTPPIAPFPNS